MHKLAKSKKQKTVRGLWLSLFTTYLLLIAVGAKAVYGLRKSCAKLTGLTMGLPQVVFATYSLSINGLIVRSLYKLDTQVSTQGFRPYNSGVLCVIPAVHRPNNEYYKGEYK